MPLLVEIGLTDLPKSGSAMTHPAHLGMIPLTYVLTIQVPTYLLINVMNMHSQKHTWS